MIQYGKQNIAKSDIKAVINCLKGRYITQGILPGKFENLLSNYLGFKYCSSVSNGTSAMFILAKLLDWKKGDIIAIPTITFVSTAAITDFFGAKPLFIDINLENYCIDTNKLELELKKGKKIKAVVVTDYGGSVANWKHLSFLKKKYNFFLINDQCHALGSEYYKSRKYSSKYCDFSILSFHPVKAITTSEGGAIFSNNKNYDSKIKLLRSHGIERRSKHWKYDISTTGFNFRLSDLSCSLGISQFKRLKLFLKKRREIAKKYNNFFKNKKNCFIPLNIKNNLNSYHLYPLRINFKKLNKTKDEFINFLIKKKIKVQFHYIPTTEFQYFKNKYNIVLNKFPNTQIFYKQVISLPIYYDLSDKDLKKILKNINIFLNKI